ncbi:hypothetical protein QEH59_00920 [Coraliomargarita sp. SDUM461004]|uniref:AAA family ATPase n=1 Tax=Thalassobacterium sedimentorum TaxID=3041258 RepID=A0ABU1AEB9_9BACT|nr:hypothetical protein [Coraliomargarita sp. SDUM461004]MDQ8192967.1 hypothetical protein [Coraliomargarita sp. SDUM461004]
MPTLSINLTNCYGIRQLKGSFDLGKHEGRGGAFSIYAANGVMKSSLARTFADHSKGEESKDLIFPSRETVRDIQWDNSELDPKTVFVIKPYVKIYESETVSTLIANPSLQQEYAISVKSLLAKRKTLTGELKQLSGITSRTETPDIVLAADLGATEEDFSEKIEALQQGDHTVAHLKDVKYAEIFNPKTLAVLKQRDFQAQLEEYVELYNKLVEESPILCRTFNHQGATAVCKGLKDAGFYTAGHFVTLKVGDSSKMISSSEELEDIFQQEREKILSDTSLKRRFDAVDKALGNADTKKLRALIESNKELLADLNDLEALKKKFWFAYFQECEEELNEFLQSSHDTKEVLTRLIASAKEEETKWTKVIQIFNRRFDVPFNISIQNQADVILKGEKPAKSFSFEDSESADGVDEKTLLSVLSRGERRALYILNLLFEVETRKEANQETLFIVDDIADSFDYRNKYAIVEYLRELSKRDGFYLIFLTHNFDFHRTLASRLGLSYDNRLVATRGANEIDLQSEKYQNDVFVSWRGKMGVNERVFIASVPFVRNLATYSGHKSVARSLTEVLHIKANSASKTYADLVDDFSIILQKALPEIKHDRSLRVLERIQIVAEEIATEAKDHIELEEKIILAIAIRLMAEKFMLRRLNDPEWEEPKVNQTRILSDKFADKFTSEQAVISTLDQVNLMTPENIHLNSFMFEPILDMSSRHLYRLHADIKQLLDGLGEVGQLD